MLLKFRKHKFGFYDVCAFILCFLFALAGSLISINRFWQYEVFFYDFGIFDQAIWNVSRLNSPIIDHLVHGGRWIFADHFNPSIFLLSPLYWLISKSEIILIAQAVVVALSGLALYFLGRKVIKSSFLSFAILSCYFLFIGLQNAVISDFHEATVATLPFVLIFLAAAYNKKLVLYIAFIILLGFKESNYLLGIVIAITLFFLKKEWRKDSAVLAFVSLIWGIAAIKFIIPHFSESGYSYGVSLSPNPINYISSLINEQIKIQTIFTTFKSFGFLPIFSPLFYLLILEDFLSRFYPPFLTLSWGLSLHYSAITSAIFGVASVYGLNSLKKKVSRKAIVLIGIVLIGNAFHANNFFFHAPLGLAVNKAFYSHSRDFEFLDKLISQVPKDATVMTQNNLASHFTHQKVLLLREKCKGCTEEHYQKVKPDYIVVDYRPGQNPNNWYGAGDLMVIVEALKKDKNYDAIYETHFQAVYKRIN